jgi:hypothetical protein
MRRIYRKAKTAYNQIYKENKIMKYMLLMYSNESNMNFTPEEQQALAKDWYAYMQEAQEAGILVDNNGLSSTATATTVRVRDGKALITDGPFAETHEQMGGYSILNVKDLDEAIHWAQKIPTAKYGSIEIRPLWSENA